MLCTVRGFYHWNWFSEWYFQFICKIQEKPNFSHIMTYLQTTSLQFQPYSRLRLITRDGRNAFFHKNFNISVKYYVKYQVKTLSYFSSLFNDYFTLNHFKNKSLTVKCLRLRFTICQTLNAHYDRSCRATLYYCWK